MEWNGPVLVRQKTIMREKLAAVAVVMKASLI